MYLNSRAKPVLIAEKLNTKTIALLKTTYEYDIITSTDFHTGHYLHLYKHKGFSQ